MKETFYVIFFIIGFGFGSFYERLTSENKYYQQYINKMEDKLESILETHNTIKHNLGIE